MNYYRRAAAVERGPDSREALYRVGDRYLRLKNPTAALRVWSTYLERYPTGEQSALASDRLDAEAVVHRLDLLEQIGLEDAWEDEMQAVARARGGIRDFDTSLLEIPEISIRMGAVYLHDLLDRYDGEADLALAAYNAGPSRADRWLREFGHEDVDAFREAIPFSETREYVLIVLRNAAVYRSLYGE